MAKKQISNAEINNQQQNTMAFLKEAFCIDGTCTPHKSGIIDGMKSIQYKLTDTKRGTFYVTLSR